MLGTKLLIFVLGLGCVTAEAPVFVGLNIPWNHFGSDIGGGSYDEHWFQAFFQKASQSGSNIARFWLHTDGNRAGLQYDSSGAVSGLTESFTDELVQLVTLAEKNEIVIQLCLWSFDMCKDETNKGSTRASVVSDETLAESYLNNALRPIMKALIGHDNVLIEVINEPEWCMKETPCNTQDCVEVADMQRFVANTAQLVHEYGFKVTVGSASLKWNSPTQPPAVAHWWSDEEMEKHASAIGCSQPTLDLYNVHYYDWMYNTDWGYDPARKNTSYWGVDDKLTVVAELPASSQHYTTDQLLREPYANGFSGSLFWAYNDPGFPIDSALAPMKDFASATSPFSSYDSLMNWLASGLDKCP